jgi:hypothetical protein
VYQTANRFAFKDGVRLTQAHFLEEMSALFLGLLHTAPCMHSDTIMITSAQDGRHGRGSLHGIGFALDIRYLGVRTGGILIVGDSTEEKQREVAEIWAGRLRPYMGPDYDIVVEGDHIHAEYDPK